MVEMDLEIQPKLSDSVTTITSVTFISITMALMIFLKTRTNPIIDINFGLTLMLIAILFFALSALSSYIDISKACCADGEQIFNMKLMSYFFGFFAFGLGIIYIVTI